MHAHFSQIRTEAMSDKIKRMLKKKIQQVYINIAGRELFASGPLLLSFYSTGRSSFARAFRKEKKKAVAVKATARVSVTGSAR